jgi:hypothetical protein
MEKQMTEKDYFDDFRFVMNKLKKRFMFEYNGVKFVSNREIIGVNPKTFELIYKNEKNGKFN